MKLGYIYTVTSGGYDDEKVRINTGEWNKIVEDERQIWFKHSTNDECLAMAFAQDGVVLVVSRIIGGDRPENNITTWIYVPSCIRISGSQLKQVVEAVKEINRRGTSTITKEIFTDNPILNADYEEKKSAPNVRPSASLELAGRYPTTDFSLTDILGQPFQEYYANFKYILLLNSKNDLKANLVDLSDKAIDKKICVLQPSAQSLKKTFGTTNVVLRLANGSHFSAPIWAKSGQIIDLVAEKSGCEPIHLKGQAIADDSEVELSLGNHEWRIAISDDLFRFVDSKSGSSIKSNRTCFIMNPSFNRQDKSLPENEINKVHIKVTAAGYDDFDGVVDLSHGATIVRLTKTLEKKQFSYTGKKGATLEVSINGEGATSQYPLDGYRAVGSRLEYLHSGFAWKEFGMGVAAAAAAFLLYLGIAWCFGEEKEDPQPNPNVSYEDINNGGSTDNISSESGGSDSSTEDNNKDNNKEAAPDNDKKQNEVATNYIEYLDNPEGVWDRNELEKFPELKGLFEELRTYDFVKIAGRVNLLQSNTFNELRNAIDANKHKKFSGTFTDKNDNKITVKLYIDRLNKPEEEKPKANTPAPTGKKTTDKANSAAGGAKKGDAKKSKSSNKGQRGSGNIKS